MGFKKIVVAGGGVLGSQIAFQSAYKGFEVAFWLRSDDSITRTKPKVEALYNTYIKELEELKGVLGNPSARYSRGLVEDFSTLTVEKIEELKTNAKKAFDGIIYETDMAKAVKDADLVIESMAEIPDAKIKFYQEMAKVLEDKTIIVTNTSSLLPSMFTEYTGRPEKYLALHFANHIWKNNTAEVMVQPKTDLKYFDQVAEFAEQIGMVALKLYKEQAGYLLNSLLIPFLQAGEMLLAKEVSDPETIDKAWMIGTGSPMGPFRILDIIGLETAKNVASMAPGAKDDPDSVNYKIVQTLNKYIEAGKTGLAAGEGFYKYK